MELPVQQNALQKSMEVVLPAFGFRPSLYQLNGFLVVFFQNVDFYLTKLIFQSTVYDGVHLIFGAVCKYRKALLKEF